MKFRNLRRTFACALSALCFLSSPAFADVNLNPAPPPEDLHLYNIVTDIPKTAWEGVKTAFSREAILPWAVVLGSTAVLYHYDPDLLNNAQVTGSSWGLGNEVKYKSVLNIGSVSLFSAPTDTAGWLYFMGDGTIPIVLSATLITTGYYSSNNRLFNTGIEMSAGLLTGSIFDQVVKHVAGRQSPSASDSPRGTFHPFPNLKAYSQNTSGYDAMASGHIMTATVMFTVLEQEYPEYNNWMYPLEAAWLTTLGFGMMNVGVHWASDYPLGIAMGYLFGRTAVLIHHPERTSKKFADWKFYPGIDGSTGTTTMNALYSW